MDAVLIANEVIGSILKRNRGAILCKLNIEKTYDNVEWYFLLAVLEKMGFGEKWCRWIKWCLSTTREQFLEASYRLARFGEEGVKGSRSHLLFADDALIFWNLDKSDLIPVGRVENVEELAKELGCKVGRLSSTHLGMPLGAPFKSVVAWDGIEERLRRDWLPRTVRMRLKHIQRDFLWGSGALEQNLTYWRFANERKALWNQVIRGKYGEQRGGWSSCEARKVSFWKDMWCETTPLSFGEMGGSRSPCFTRPFNDWKMEEVEMLFCCLGGKKVNVGEEEDRVRWMDSKDCLFSPEGRSSGPPRQTMVMAKDRDMLKDGGVGSDLVEEKIRRLPAGGEGWDKKMKGNDQ
ncbi:hypothetical protein CK203_099625 [Vitis vinifera]|uniref:Reverse transcriptase domain-containing protein n=1 Tax=Vitis vinifera TaxID=29760 RepID=A0A438DNG5_VITVI|nr:hypothetical protein CK203_099625 [Vitis vinifera]